MANPASYRPSSGEIPTNPGVYRFRDEHRRVIYVGKAKNLRSRLNSYFASPDGLMPKTRAMVFTAASVEWTVVRNELEALQLEFTWIKEYNPRFNIAFRDDKSYPYLAVTMGEKYPRVQVMRGDRNKGTRYFGPYSQVWAIRETVDTLLRVFPVRTCSNGVFNRAQRSGRPCLLGYIDKCSAPCVGRISPEDHQALAAEFCSFMNGQAKQFITGLEEQMAAAVAELDYERAAKLRDDVAALRKVFERQAVVLAEDTDADIFALSGDELEAAVQVFHVRGGRIRGQRGWVVEKVEDASEADLIEHLIQQVYGGATRASEKIPRQILVPELPANAPELQEWLRGLRGSKVDLRVPQRGDKAALLRTVHENAEQALKLHKSRRAGDLTTRSAALQELQEALDVPVPLMRIECFDISHVSGTNVVGSMVVVEDGLPRKSEYRKFSVTGEAARDDTASMYDVVSRRFRNYLWEKDTVTELEAGQQPDTIEGAGLQAGGQPETGQESGSGDAVRMDTTTASPKGKFAYPPNLVVVDGGPPQVSAAALALDDLGIDDVYVIGLAKRLEEVWVPHSDFPVILPRASQALFLLQRVRDEAHRFAITFHRQKRGKSMTASALDSIEGMGPAKRKALLKHFGSVKKIKAADPAQLQEAPGIGPALAETIYSHLASGPAGGGAGEENGTENGDNGTERDDGGTGNDDAGPDGQDTTPPVNMATGEILEP